MADLERRRHEIETELADVNARLANVDVADAEAVARWELGERKES